MHKDSQSVGIEALGGSEDISIRKRFSFSQSPLVKLEVSIKNIGQTPLEMGLKLHNYLNIWRSSSKTAAYKLYSNPDGKVLEYSLHMDCPENINIAGGDFCGIIDSARNGLLFETDNGKTGKWYSWLGSEKAKGTIELLYGNIKLAAGDEWKSSCKIIISKGLESFGAVNNDAVFSLANPEFNALILNNMSTFNGMLKIKDGREYSCSRAIVDAGDIINVPLSAITDPGDRQFAYGGKTVDIPSVCETLPKDESDAKPYQYVNLMSAKMPSASSLGVVYFPSDYYQQVIYASPDIVSMIAFGQNVAKAAKGDLWLIVVLPEGIEVLGGRFIKQAIEKNPLLIEGKNYNRFRIKISYQGNATRPNVTELIVKCQLKAPQSLFAYYDTELDGKLAGLKQIPLEIISVPNAGMPKKMFSCFWGLYGTLNAYPDMSSFARIGIALPDDNYFDSIIKTGLLSKYTAAQGYLRFESKEADSACIDRNGKKSGELACPSYRGEGVNKLIADGIKALDDSVMLHGFDPERSNGMEICFCERCLKQFDQYLGDKNIPHKANFSRDELYKLLSADKQINALWLEFKLHAECERYKLYRDAMIAHLEKSGKDAKAFKMFLAAQPGWANPDKICGTSLQSPALLKAAFDYYCPMIYIDINGRFSMKADMQELPREISALQKAAGPTFPIIPVISVGYPYSSFVANIEPGVMKWQILESFASGARGLMIYSEGWYDALDMKYTAEAMRQVLKAEDIFLNGNPIQAKRLENLSQNTYVKGIELTPGDAVILVSDYSAHKKTASIKYDCQGAAKVIDLDNDSVLAVISAEKPVFNVELDKERARLLMIKPESTGWFKSLIEEIWR